MDSQKNKIASKKRLNDFPYCVRRFIRECIQKHGTHLLEIGQTGTGKTQGLYFIIHLLLLFARQETLVWLDTGKSSEFLTLARFAPLNLIIPEGCDMEIEYDPSCTLHPITKTYFVNIRDVWRLIKKDSINVICIRRFVRDRVYYTTLISDLFDELIELAFDYRLITPMTVFSDEMQQVCPAQNIAYDNLQYKSGLNVADALFTLRSLHVRMCGAVQAWNVVNPPARNGFPWLMIRNNTFFNQDQPRLMRFNLVWEQLEKEMCYLVDPQKNFSDKVSLHFYGDGEDLGRVRYHGRLSPPQKKTAPPKASA